VIDEKMNTIFETKFKSFVQILAKKDSWSYSKLLRIRLSLTLLSRIGSTTALRMWYPVDDIMGYTTCRRHIPLGRVRNKTKEVVIRVAMSGRVFHNNPIPTEYAKVLVHEITDMSYIDYPLDHVMPEGVKELGEAANQFILWNRREIILDGPTLPRN
jgi:hypothetical protein